MVMACAGRDNHWRYLSERSEVRTCAAETKNEWTYMFRTVQCGSLARINCKKAGMSGESQAKARCHVPYTPNPAPRGGIGRSLEARVHTFIQARMTLMASLDA
ncbi:hypothetical protein C2E23DRAFT_139698 [Lenzites betulinus]|nr:hypothetical protein C2E23DRAFT_139698 [Lenzites betulinus]